MSARQSQKSTIVRSVKWGTRAVIARSLHAIAPQLAANMVARWFLEPEDLGVARTSTGEPFAVRVGGVELAGRSWGRGPVIALVHGWNGRADQLALVGAAIAERGHRAIAIDLPGHGDSPGSELTIPLIAQSVAAVGDLVGPIKAVVAHSLGAVGATLAFAEGLDVERAAFIAPPDDPVRWIGAITRALGLPRETVVQVVEAVEHRVGVTLAEIEPMALAPSMTADLLVVHDRDDREVPFAAASAYTGAWPDASLLVTRGLGHTRILRDDRVIDAVASYVTGATVAEATRILGSGDDSAAFETREPRFDEVVEQVAAAL